VRARCPGSSLRGLAALAMAKPLALMYHHLLFIWTAVAAAVLLVARHGALAPLFVGPRLPPGMATGRLNRETASAGRPVEAKTQMKGMMGWHARDYMGVKHVETRQQGQKASRLVERLRTIFERRLMYIGRHGDSEFQSKLYVDDVIYTSSCHTAHVHISAEGSELEKRQAYVWLARNKGKLQTAIMSSDRRAPGLGHTARMPRIKLHVSRFQRYTELFEKAEQFPNSNLPNPHEAVEVSITPKLRRWLNPKPKPPKGVGDPRARTPPSGWNPPTRYGMEDFAR